MLPEVSKGRATSYQTKSFPKSGTVATVSRTKRSEAPSAKWLRPISSDNQQLTSISFQLDGSEITAAISQDFSAGMAIPPT